MSCWKWKTFNKYEPRERTYIKNTHQRSNGRNCPPASQHKRMSLNTNVPGRKNERDCFFRTLVTAVLQIFFLWYHFFQLYFNRHTHTHTYTAHYHASDVGKTMSDAPFRVDVYSNVRDTGLSCLLFSRKTDISFRRRQAMWTREQQQKKF